MKNKKGRMGWVDGLPLPLISVDDGLGKDVKIYAFVHPYGCIIGCETKVGTTLKSTVAQRWSSGT